MKSSIQSLEVEYLVHATEDPKKLEGAVSRLLGAGAGPEVERLEGHFGNEVLKARFHFTGADAEEGFKHMLASFPSAVLAEVASAIGSFLDEHNALYLRFDKQRLVSGTPALASGDSVRVKVKPRGFLKGEAQAFYLKLLGRG